MRVCTESGCPELVEAGYCADHRRAREKRRGTRQERGYDLAFDKARKRWARQVAAGSVICWSCHDRISPLEPFDLGHCEIDRSIIHGPQHPRCNRDTSRAGCTHTSHI